MESRKDIGTFAILAIITALGVTAASILAPVEVRFLETLTRDTTLIGARYSVLALFFGIFSLIIGRLSSIYGKKPFVIIGSILAVVYPLLFASSAGIYQYLMFAIIAAFAGASFEPIFSAIIQDALKKVRACGKYMGFYFALSAISGSIGAFIGGAVADAYGLKAPFYAVTIVEAIAAVFAIGFIIRYKEGKKSPVKQQEPDKKDILFSLKYIAKDPVLIFHLILETAFNLYWSIKPILFPLAIFAIAKSNTATGSVFAAMGIMAMFVLPLAGHYIDKKGYIPGAKIGYFILGTSSLALAFSNTLPMFFLFAGIFAIGEAINGPLSSVIEIKRIKNHHRTELMGFYYAYNSFTSVLSPLIAGSLLAFLPTSKVLLIYAGFIWIGIAAAFGILGKQTYKPRRTNKSL